jgi:hypothetical protein
VSTTRSEENLASVDQTGALADPNQNGADHAGRNPADVAGAQIRLLRILARHVAESLRAEHFNENIRREP